MSKFGVAVIAVALATAMLSTSPSKGRRHLGFGSLGSAFTHLFAPFYGRVHHRRLHVRRIRSAPASSPDMPTATKQPAGEPGLNVGNLFTDPVTRGQIAATAALAVWRNEHGNPAGWWSHGHGGYGWVGPLFWPFADNDVYGYVVFGDKVGFWDYGYSDINAGIFGPYSNDELAAYTEPGSRRAPGIPPLNQLCGDAGREIAGLAIDQIQRAVGPTEAQRAALDHVADTANSAAQIIQESCPTPPASTAPARLALMRQRVAAILKAVISLEPPLQELYDLLNDEQKTRLNALADPRLKTASASRDMTAPIQDCEASSPVTLRWPAGEIEALLQPNDAQHDALERLQRASAQAVDILNYECRPADANTPPERLAAVDRRLDTMQQAINMVSAPLEDFYATLSDEQKSQFELIGPKREP